MPTINDNFLKLQAGYLFPEIERRVAEFTKTNSDAAAKIIKMGIGDVTEPLPEACVVAMHKAVDDQSKRESFTDTARSRGMPGCARRSLSTITWLAAVISVPTRCSSPTAPSVTAPTSWTSLAVITSSL